MLASYGFTGSPGPGGALQCAEWYPASAQAWGSTGSLSTQVSV